VGKEVHISIQQDMHFLDVLEHHRILAEKNNPNEVSQMASSDVISQITHSNFIQSYLKVFEKRSILEKIYTLSSSPDSDSLEV